MRRLALWLLMPVLFLSIGLQWACLQSAAWVGMVVSYSQQASLNEALVMTFDGKHPCKLCKAVENGQKSQTKQDTRPTTQKFDLALTEVEHMYFVHESKKVESFVVIVHAGHDIRPPTPPPRVG